MSNNYNTMNNNSEKNAKSVILTLESLMNQYDTTLIQYQQASADYLSSMQQMNSKSSLTVVPGSVYWGSATLENIQGPHVTQSSCLDACAGTKGCSGATFNVESNGNGKPTCFLRSGDGTVIPAGSNDYAIVPYTKMYLLNMQNLNQQLVDINRQILNISESQGGSIYKSEEVNRSMKNKELKKNYNKLVKDRKNIENQLNRFQDLEEEQNDTELVTNSNYFSFVLLMILAILCFVVLFNVSAIFGSGNSSNSDYGNQFGGRMGNKAYFIVLAILLLIGVAYYYKKTFV